MKKVNSLFLILNKHLYLRVYNLAFVRRNIANTWLQGTVHHVSCKKLKRHVDHLIHCTDEALH